MTAAGAIAALIAATLYAPLFHLHTDAGELPLIHAHLPEFEVAEDESVVHMEPPHSHVLARSVDLLISNTAHAVHLDGILVSTEVVPNSVQPRCGFVLLAAARSHDPPDISSCIPRAPPA